MTAASFCRIGLPQWVARPFWSPILGRMGELGRHAGEQELEADLLAVAERRDLEAFRRLFAFYAPRIKAYLRRQGAEDALAEDLTQEAMLSVWRRAYQFDRSRAALST